MFWYAILWNNIVWRTGTWSSWAEAEGWFADTLMALARKLGPDREILGEFELAGYCNLCKQYSAIAVFAGDCGLVPVCTVCDHYAWACDYPCYRLAHHRDDKPTLYTPYADWMHVSIAEEVYRRESGSTAYVAEMHCTKHGWQPMMYDHCCACDWEWTNQEELEETASALDSQVFAAQPEYLGVPA